MRTLAEACSLRLIRCPVVVAGVDGASTTHCFVSRKRWVGVNRSAQRNMSSAEQNPDMVQKYLAKEKALGRVIVVNPADCWPIHINRFGVIPKKHQPGKWRLIVDLSHPRGAGINDGVDPQVCSLSYTFVEAAATKVLELGSGSLLAKLDLESACRMIPSTHKIAPYWG